MRVEFRLSPIRFAAIAAMTWALSASPALAGSGDDDGWGASSMDAGPDPVSISAVAGSDGAHPGGLAELAVIVDMQSEWHVNSHVPLEEWLIPTVVLFEDDVPFEVVETIYPEHHELEFSFSEVPMAVYEGTATIGLRVRIDEGATGESITVSGLIEYQACNDQTCLPPTEKPFEVSFPLLAANVTPTPMHQTVMSRVAFPPIGGTRALETPEGTTQTAPAEVAETDAVAATSSGPGLRDRLEGALASNFGNPLIAVILTFLAGLLSAATPCVYPMIPITARILVSRGGGNSALGNLHAVMYFVGIILVYAVLGTIASATGGGFNAIMTIPWVILSFSILFALLGLSMFGLFEIQIPASVATKVDSSTSSRNGLLGTVLMGVGAGVVVSPCVGPVVVFILTSIAAEIARIQATGGSVAGQIAYGGFLMAGYGAGLGLLFLLVGLFSSRVQVVKPGPWMTAVRVALGAVIIYFAYDYFHKALGTAGVERPIANAILLGVVLVFLAVFWGVFRTKIEEGPHAGWQRVRLASTIIMLIVGAFFLWTGLTRSGLVPGGSTQLDPALVAALARDGGGGPEMEDSHGLIWHRDFTAAQEEARETGLPIFVDFYANWCANCKAFSKDAAEQGPLRDALEQVVRAKVYEGDVAFTEFQQDDRYPELKRRLLPFFVILSSEGEFLWKGSDYRAHETFIQELERAKRREVDGRVSVGSGVRVTSG